jgi:phosphoenolpyruvate synthase/pyruvate phosphate dikinase
MATTVLAPVRSFTDLSREDVGGAGGKGANLSAPIPDALGDAIRAAYAKLARGDGEPVVAVARAAALPVDGVGLLRAELMVLEALEGSHPRLLLEEGRSEDFVSRMADGLTTFAAGFAPRPVT